MYHRCCKCGWRATIFTIEFSDRGKCFICGGAMEKVSFEDTKDDHNPIHIAPPPLFSVNKERLAKEIVDTEIRSPYSVDRKPKAKKAERKERPHKRKHKRLGKRERLAMKEKQKCI